MTRINLKNLNYYQRKRLIMCLCAMAVDALIVYAAVASGINSNEQYNINDECLDEIYDSIDPYALDLAEDVIYLKAQNEKNKKEKQNSDLAASVFGLGCVSIYSGVYCKKLKREEELDNNVLSRK